VLGLGPGLPRLPSGLRPLRVLGRGGGGCVVEAVEEELDRTVAVKILSGEQPEAGARAHREAEALARLRHPNVVVVHSVLEQAGLTYIVMERVEGESLAQRLARQGPLPVEEALELTRTLAGAVDQVHAAGVLHRDLKPSNVIADADGRPRLVDFGLARSLSGSSLTNTGAVLGTPGFMSPEQLLGRVPDARTDVYGLGAVLYALLTADPPSAGGPPSTSLHRPPCSPRLIRPEIPRGVEEVCLRCLHPDPSRRYQSAAELGQALRGLRAGQRSRVSAWLPVAALALAAAAGLTAWQLSPPGLPPEEPAARSPDDSSAPTPSPEQGNARELDHPLLLEHEVCIGAFFAAGAPLTWSPRTVRHWTPDGELRETWTPPDRGLETAAGAFSSSRIVVAGLWGARFLDLESGAWGGRLPYPVVARRDLTVSSDGRVAAILTAGDSGEDRVVLLDSATGTEAATLRWPKPTPRPELIALSADGARVAVVILEPEPVHTWRLELWRWSTHTLERTYEPLPVRPRAMTFSLDGLELALGDDVGRVIVYRLDDPGQTVPSERVRPMDWNPVIERAHVSSVSTLQYLPDGRLLSLSSKTLGPRTPGTNDLAVWSPNGSLAGSHLRSGELRYMGLSLDPERNLLLLTRRDPRQAWLLPAPFDQAPR
jgi:serine/threonine protein kinase